VKRQVELEVLACVPVFDGSGRQVRYQRGTPTATLDRDPADAVPPVRVSLILTLPDSRQLRPKRTRRPCKCADTIRSWIAASAASCCVLGAGPDRAAGGPCSAAGAADTASPSTTTAAGARAASLR